MLYASARALLRLRLAIFVFCFASAVVEFLNFFHRVCGFSVSHGMSISLSFWISSSSTNPRSTTASIQSSLSKVWVGRVHLSFPMVGALAGVYLARARLWSVGTAVGVIFHSRIRLLMVLAVYIWSRCDWICWLLVFVR
jgi:hypothetical protein